mmetsp:Transcript_8262/g.13825  ORF Transcript_8262/g.13825 Transcript_8262/m.13825 type:complete len:125 (-) Transcript_8262:35-409(-)
MVPTSFVKKLEGYRSDGILMAREAIFIDVFYRELSKMVEPARKAVRDYFKAKYGKDYKVGAIRRLGDILLLPHSEPKAIEGLFDPRDFERMSSMQFSDDLSHTDLRPKDYPVIPGFFTHPILII